MSVSWSSVVGLGADSRSAAPSASISLASRAPEPGGVVGVAGGGHAHRERAVGRQRDRPEPELLAVVALDDLGQRADRGRAAALERGEHGPLGRRPRPGWRGSSSAASAARRASVVGAALDGEGALAGRGQHLQRVEHLGDLLQPADARQAGAGQHHGVELAGADLADPGVDVATNADHVQTEAEGVQLGDPARRAGADRAADGQLAEGEAVAGDDDVARVLAQWARRRATMPSAGTVGRSLSEWTATSTSPAQQRVAQRADEDAGAAGRDVGSGVPAAWVRSPSVVTSTSSVSRPRRSRSSVGDLLGLGGGQQRGAGADPDDRGRGVVRCTGDALLDGHRAG